MRPMTGEMIVFTRAHDPDAMPVMSAAFSRGYVNELAFSATIWNPPARKVENDTRRTASITELTSGVRPKDSERTVSRTISPTGRGFVAAYLSAAHPQKK